MPAVVALRKSSSQKLAEPVAPEFSSADAKIHATRLPRLSFLVLHLSQSPKRVPADASWNSMLHTVELSTCHILYPYRDLASGRIVV